jgi:hypothetical protein
VSLGSLKGLQDLRFFSPIELTDVELAHIDSLTALRYLALDCCTMTDAALACLHSLPALQMLMLYFCNELTDEAVCSLQKSLPGCQIKR